MHHHKQDAFACDEQNDNNSPKSEWNKNLFRIRIKVTAAAESETGKQR